MYAHFCSKKESEALQKFFLQNKSVLRFGNIFGLNKITWALRKYKNTSHFSKRKAAFVLRTFTCLVLSQKMILGLQHFAT
jgi:hypothetical protein